MTFTAAAAVPLTPSPSPPAAIDVHIICKKTQTIEKKPPTQNNILFRPFDPNLFLIIFACQANTGVMGPLQTTTNKQEKSGYNRPKKIRTNDKMIK